MAPLVQADICTWQLVPGDSSDSSSGSASGAASTAPGAGVAGVGGIRLRPNKAVVPHLPQLLHSTASAAAHQAMDPATTATEVAALLDWALLQQLLDDGEWAGAGSLQLLAGGRDSLLPARYHTRDRCGRAPAQGMPS